MRFKLPHNLNEVNYNISVHSFSNLKPNVLFDDTIQGTFSWRPDHNR